MAAPPATGVNTYGDDESVTDDITMPPAGPTANETPNASLMSNAQPAARSAGEADGAVGAVDERVAAHHEIADARAAHDAGMRHQDERDEPGAADVRTDVE